jgi:DNA ligase (NAD+)
MLSLAKTWTLNGLETWYTRISRILGHAPGLVCEPKVDGVGVELHYRAGVLVLARTRSGLDIGTIFSPDLPMMLTDPVDVVVRGEAWVPRDEASGYSSPRAAAVAALQSYPPRPVRVIVWDVESEPIADDHHGTLAALRALGLPTTTCESVELDAVASLPRPEVPYDCDGAVVKVAGMADRQLLGCTATAPRWAMALKWAPG